MTMTFGAVRPLLFVFAATVALFCLRPLPASALCGTGGFMTFENDSAIREWRFHGNGGIDYDNGTFPPEWQGRFKNDFVHSNNGWIRGTTGWHSMERTLHSPFQVEQLMITPYMQGSPNLTAMYLSVLDPATGAVLQEQVIDVVAAHRRILFVTFTNLPQTVVIRLGFHAQDSDTWLQLDSLDLRVFDFDFDGHCEGKLVKEMF